MMSPWAYPENRYYYEWYEQEPPGERSDMEVKQDLLDRLRPGPYEDEGAVAGPLRPRRPGREGRGLPPRPRGLEGRHARGRGRRVGHARRQGREQPDRGLEPDRRVRAPPRIDPGRGPAA